MHNETGHETLIVCIMGIGPLLRLRKSDELYLGVIRERCVNPKFDIVRECLIIVEKWTDCSESANRL